MKIRTVLPVIGSLIFLIGINMALKGEQSSSSHLINSNSFTVIEDVGIIDSLISDSDSSKKRKQFLISNSNDTCLSQPLAKKRLHLATSIENAIEKLPELTKEYYRSFYVNPIIRTILELKGKKKFLNALNLLLTVSLQCFPTIIISLISGYCEQFPLYAINLIHTAAKKGYEEIVNVLLKTYPESIDSIKFNTTLYWKPLSITPLHVAAYYNRKEVVKLLLIYGAHPFIADNGKALTRKEAVESLLNYSDSKSEATTPLYIARNANRGKSHYEVIKILKSKNLLGYYERPHKNPLLWLDFQ